MPVITRSFKLRNYPLHCIVIELLWAGSFDQETLCQVARTHVDDHTQAKGAYRLMTKPVENGTVKEYRGRIAEGVAR